MSNEKLEHLKCAFPKLTEANQQYMLGVAEGLKYAQNNGEKEKQNGMKTGEVSTEGGIQKTIKRN